jgi:thiamine monophosphate kinase
MREIDLIETLAAVHGSTPFTADAEILPNPSGGFTVASTDSFSETEDFLTGLTPEQTGRQMAYGAVSDLLACGVQPRFLLQNWSTDADHPLEFYRDVATGIQQVLEHYGATCVGGDVGTSDHWQWTATVIGYSSAPVTRQAARRVPFNLYATGPMGEANAAVFLNQPLPPAVFRAPVPTDALFATDSSGGFLDALQNFHRANHGLLLDVYLERALSSRVRQWLPPGAEPGWTLVGGVGEYELVFALPKDASAPPNVLKIGEGSFTDSADNVIRLHATDGRRGTLRPLPDYRDIPPSQWVEATASCGQSLFA